jgi:hypothetical protein
MIKFEENKNDVFLGSVHRTYDVNGDMILSETKDANGVVTRSINYEYDLSKLDKSGSWGQSDANGTGSVFPKMAQHMIKKLTINQNNTIKVNNFSYTLDAQGYVVTGTCTNEQNVITDTWTNSWQ